MSTMTLTKSGHSAPKNLPMMRAYLHMNFCARPGRRGVSALPAHSGRSFMIILAETSLTYVCRHASTCLLVGSNQRADPLTLIEIASTSKNDFECFAKAPT